MASKGTKIVISILLTVATLFVAYRFISAFFVIYIETQAEKEMEIGNYEEAVDKLLLSQKFLFPGETTETNSSLLGSCYLELEMYDEAIERFQEAIDENGKDNEVIYYTNIGIAYAKMGDYDRAREYLKKSMSCGYNNADIIRGLIDELEQEVDQD